ncbi:preprotein translocase subunit YajC [Desulfopila sp. IMCC35006]|uniref:preprotein translocase subunit YajC n=1 Tax=Desulfopila sp. IMCC35006 TaxID=2569542 RepID=UPI0010AC2E5E|nr:preprotein translocase subunit YajC [Desulfopila sp. IMCC35006]TKB24463.1 preprotein translocase subunit YajC [Desulfopila sp. IMCC35006]
MTGIAYAAAPAAGGSMGAGGFASFIPLILIFVVFYFLLIRPQQKQAKLHQAFLNDLKKGQKVVTKGGLHGVILAVADTVITLEIAKDISVKVSRDAIGGSLNKDGGTAPVKKDLKSSGG